MRKALGSIPSVSICHFFSGESLFRKGARLGLVGCFAGVVSGARVRPASLKGWVLCSLDDFSGESLFRKGARLGHVGCFAGLVSGARVGPASLTGWVLWSLDDGSKTEKQATITGQSTRA